MQLLSTRTHGVIDYALAVVLMTAPHLFGFANGGAAQWLPVLLGIAIIVYSLMTRYELGFVHAISMPVHLGLDVAAGVLLTGSPWLFGFADQVALPHAIVGLTAIIVAGLTTTQTTLVRPGIEDREPPRMVRSSSLDRSGAAGEMTRARSDRGLSNDKVSAPDPAAAPLGTDDEAGGYRR